MTKAEFSERKEAEKAFTADFAEYAVKSVFKNAADIEAKKEW